MSTDEMAAPRLYSLADAESYLGIPRRQLWKLVASGAVPGVRVGDKWHLHLETLQHIERNGCPVPGASADDDRAGE